MNFDVPEECGCIDIFSRNPQKMEICGYAVTKPFDCEDEFSTQFYELLKENNFEIDLLKTKELLKTTSYRKSEEFALDPCYRIDAFSKHKRYIGFLRKSYKTIIRGDILGEEYFYVPIKSRIYNKNRATTISYRMTFVLMDRLERFSFGINSIENSAEDLVTFFPYWFEIRSDGNYYWINQESLNAMYDLLFSDDYKKLPRDFQLIRETRDMILNTVRINNPPVDTSKLKEGVITH